MRSVGTADDLWLISSSIFLKIQWAEFSFEDGVRQISRLQFQVPELLKFTSSASQVNNSGCLSLPQVCAGFALRLHSFTHSFINSSSITEAHCHGWCRSWGYGDGAHGALVSSVLFPPLWHGSLQALRRAFQFPRTPESFSTYSVGGVLKALKGCWHGPLEAGKGHQSTPSLSWAFSDLQC